MLTLSVILSFLGNFSGLIACIALIALTWLFQSEPKEVCSLTAKEKEKWLKKKLAPSIDFRQYGTYHLYRGRVH
jgi:hypothetical protein